MFDTDPMGIDGEVLEALRDAIAYWRAVYADSSLTRFLGEDGLHIADRRTGWPWVDHHITDPALIAAYLELEHGRSLSALQNRLRDRQYILDEADLLTWLRKMCDAGLLFGENNRYVTLATTNIPRRGFV